jgi:hypothetical protein
MLLVSASTRKRNEKESSFSEGRKYGDQSHQVFQMKSNQMILSPNKQLKPFQGRKIETERLLDLCKLEQ